VIFDSGASVSRVGNYLRRNHLHSALEPDATAGRTLCYGEGEMSVFILRVALHRRSEPMVTTPGAQKTRSEYCSVRKNRKVVHIEQELEC